MRDKDSLISARGRNADAPGCFDTFGRCPPYYFTPGDTQSLESAKKACKADKYERGDCGHVSSGTAGPAC